MAIARGSAYDRRAHGAASTAITTGREADMSDDVEGSDITFPEVTITGTVEEGQAYADGQAAAEPGASNRMSAIDRAHPDAHRQGYMDKALELAESELDEEAGRRNHAEFVESIRGDLFKDSSSDR
jgi:hypothetical protein